jgi:hypothetical protein
LKEAETSDPNAAALGNLIERYWRFESLNSDFLSVDGDRADYLFNWGITKDDFDNALSSIQKALSTIRGIASACYLQRTCAQVQNLPSIYEFRPFLPLKKGSFPVDVALRDSGAHAQAIVAKFNADRASHMAFADTPHPFFGGGPNCQPGAYMPNHIFTQWSEPTWLNTVWPVIAAFENNLQNYPSALREQFVETRMEAPWRAYCKSDTDMDCIDHDELTHLEDKIEMPPARHASVNGTGAFPGGEATRCADGISAKFNPNID